jgi:hypothetical protein
MVLSLLCVLAAPADAQWKWRDKDGQVNASDRPPPRDIPEKDILARPTPEQRRTLPVLAPDAAASAASGAAPTALEREINARKRAAEQEQSAKSKAEAEANAARRAENCRNARSHESTLNSDLRIARTNAAGEREFLDDKARAAELARARSVIASDCR